MHLEHDGGKCSGQLSNHRYSQADVRLSPRSAPASWNLSIVISFHCRVSTVDMQIWQGKLPRFQQGTQDSVRIKPPTLSS